MRLLLWLLGEAIAGVLLYALFTFIPVTQGLVVVAWLVIQNDRFDRKEKKSRVTLPLLFAIFPAVFCFVAWFVTHEAAWSRLALAGICLMGAVIFIDRRGRLRTE